MHSLSALVGYAIFCNDALDGEFKRVGFSGGAKFYPVGLPVFVYSPQFEGVGGFRCQVFKEQRGVFDGGVEHAVEADFVEIGVVHFFPGGGQFVGFGVGIRDLCVCRSGERTCAYSVFVCRSECESIDGKDGGVCGDVCRSEFYE